MELGFRALCREDSSVRIAEVEFEDRLEVWHCVSGLFG